MFSVSARTHPSSTLSVNNMKFEKIELGGKRNHTRVDLNNPQPSTPVVSTAAVRIHNPQPFNILISQTNVHSTISQDPLPVIITDQ